MKEALLDLVDTLHRHVIVVEGNVGQGVGTSRDGTSGIGTSRADTSRDVTSGAGTSRADTSRARTSPTKDLVRSPHSIGSRDHSGHVEGSEHHVMLHPCTSYRNIFYGPSLEFRIDRLLQYVSQTHPSHSLLFFISQYSIVS